MINIFTNEERGITQTDWLHSWHSFSFNNYHNPDHMGFRSLRVINEDIIAAGRGFGKHPHSNMEIITYVINGELKHEDSGGHSSTIKPGVVQKMSAGRRITHSEFNASEVELLHLFQIWIEPNIKDIEPAYEEREINFDQGANELILIGAPAGEHIDNCIPIHQDCYIYCGKLEVGRDLSAAIDDERHYYLHLISGEVQIGDLIVDGGDAVEISLESSLNIKVNQDSELLFFDLA